MVVEKAELVVEKKVEVVEVEEDKQLKVACVNLQELSAQKIQMGQN